MRAQKRLTQGALAVAIMALIHAPPAAMAAAPAECYTDDGILVTPRSNSNLTGQSDWTLTLNFNHQLDTKFARGCFAIRQAATSTVVFVVTNCPIKNNVRGIGVGNGQAEFDGNIVINCSPLNALGKYLGGGDWFENFSVHSKLVFPKMGRASLARTKEMSFAASANEMGNLLINSTYGKAGISDSHTSAPVFKQLLSVESMLIRNKATEVFHIVNGVNLPAQPGAPFYLSYSEVIEIGAVGDRFILNEIIIDPGTRCCRPG